MAYNKKKVLQTWDVGRNPPMTASRGEGMPERALGEFCVRIAAGDDEFGRSAAGRLYK